LSKEVALIQPFASYYRHTTFISRECTLTIIYLYRQWCRPRVLYTSISSLLARKVRAIFYIREFSQTRVEFIDEGSSLYICQVPVSTESRINFRVSLANRTLRSRESLQLCQRYRSNGIESNNRYCMYVYIYIYKYK